MAATALPAAAFTRSLRAASRRRKPHVDMTTGPHRGSREPPGQPDVDADACRRGVLTRPAGQPPDGKARASSMMPGPFSWSTGPLHRATPETATHHVHATGPNKRVSSAPNGVQPHWSLPFYVTHYGVLHTRGREQREHRRTPRTNPNARRVYLDPAKPPKAHQPVSHGCTLPALERGGAMYFRMAKSRRSVRTTQHWRTVIASSKP